MDWNGCKVLVTGGAGFLGANLCHGLAARGARVTALDGFLFGGGANPANLDGAKDIVRTFNDRGEPLSELSDSNYDGKIDTWITFARGRVAKMQVDTTGSGQADETRFYVGGKLSRAQRDSNHDGKPDVWEVYEEGKLQRIGNDLDFDGHVDRWDRDEIALREIAEKEKQEADAEQKKADQEKAREGGGADAGATDARVSARRRQ